MSKQKHPQELIDVRQSPEWAKFLETIGWQSVRTSRGINIETRKTVFGTFVKIQKPVPLTSSDLKEVEKVCKQLKALFIKIEPYLGQNTDLLKDEGYEISWVPMTPPATYFIHLDKEEKDLWEAVSHSAKYSIHRAEREGTEVKMFQNPPTDKMEEFYELLKYTGSVQKIYVPPIRQIKNQIESFGKQGFLFMVYDKHGNVCGGKWFATYNNIVLYVSGGTSKIGRANKSGYLLLWKAILYFKSLGLSVMDLEGKDDPRFPGFTKRWGGFSHFKEKFGGEAVEFPLPQVKYLSKFMRFMRKWSAFTV